MSVLVPFAGGREEAARTTAAFVKLRLGSDDEGVIADNSADGVMESVELPPGWRVVPAKREGSPAHTRNVAALAAQRDWLLFLDSDTQPPADLLERFFAEPIPDEVGVVGGRLLSDSAQETVAARWADDRGMTAQETHVIHPFRPYFLSANLLVRREIWEELGGFYEGIFNGEDVDLCWRAQEAGWKLELRPEAAVVHVHRETVKGLMKQSAVRGASASWVYRRWPQAVQPKRPGALLIAKGILVSPLMFLAGQRERAQLRALDVATQLAERWGKLRPNRARPRPPAQPASSEPVEIWCEEFPRRSGDSVAEEARTLARGGHPVLVVAARRPDRPGLGVHDVQVHYLEDETSLERAIALLELVARRPLAVSRERGREGSPIVTLAPSALRLRGRPEARVRARGEGPWAQSARRVARLAGREASIEPAAPA